MKREFVDWYGQRNWTRDGTVRTMTRIDVPPGTTVLAPGEYNIAGVAYAGARGVESVEYSFDNGSTWQAAAFVEPAVGQDAWVRWIGRFEVQEGAALTLTARATDGTGATQPMDFSLPQPNGSTGWPMIEIGSVSAPTGNTPAA
jgi:hypothetical protein